MYPILRKWLISVLVIVCISFFISTVIGDDPIWLTTIFITIALIISSWFLGIVSAASNVLHYMLFKSDISARFADKLVENGGLPEPERFTFEVDNYLSEIINNSDNQKHLINASILLGERASMRNSGMYIGLFIQGKILKGALDLLHTEPFRKTI